MNAINEICMMCRCTLPSRTLLLLMMLNLLCLVAHLASDVAATPDVWGSAQDTTRVALIIDEVLAGEATDHEDFNANLNLGYSKSSSSMFQSEVSVSTQCWRAALASMYSSDDRFRSVGGAATLCAMLPEAYQKRLALEISKCHMQDMNVPLYQTAAIEHRCTSGSFADTLEVLPRCLQHLTTSGQQTYTHFLTYLQILCTRQTQELFLQYQQEATDRMAAEYAAISSQSIETLLSMANELGNLSEVASVVSSATDELKNLSAIPSIVSSELNLVTSALKNLSDIPSMVRDQVSVDLNSVLNMITVDLQMQVKQALSHVWDEQVNDRLGQLMEQMQQLDAEHRDRYDDFTTYQSSVLLQQSREMERQKLALEDHRVKVQRLSETVSETTKHMQPLHGLQRLIQTASDGYTWISFLLHFLVTFNIVWIVSRPERCMSFRSYLYTLVVTEGLIELLLTGAMRYEILTEHDQIACIAELRRWAILLYCITYVIGMATSFFSTIDQPASAATPNTALTRLELERMLDDRMRLIPDPKSPFVPSESADRLLDSETFVDASQYHVHPASYRSYETDTRAQNRNSSEPKYINLSYGDHTAMASSVSRPRQVAQMNETPMGDTNQRHECMMQQYYHHNRNDAHVVNMKAPAVSSRLETAPVSLLENHHHPCPSEHDSNHSNAGLGSIVAPRWYDTYTSPPSFAARGRMMESPLVAHDKIDAVEVSARDVDRGSSVDETTMVAAVVEQMVTTVVEQERPTGKRAAVTPPQEEPAPKRAAVMTPV